MEAYKELFQLDKRMDVNDATLTSSGFAVYVLDDCVRLICLYSPRRAVFDLLWPNGTTFKPIIGIYAHDDKHTVTVTLCSDAGQLYTYQFNTERPQSSVQHKQSAQVRLPPQHTATSLVVCGPSHAAVGTSGGHVHISDFSSDTPSTVRVVYVYKPSFMGMLARLKTWITGDGYGPLSPDEMESGERVGAIVRLELNTPAGVLNATTESSLLKFKLDLKPDGEATGALLSVTPHEAREEEDVPMEHQLVDMARHYAAENMSEVTVTYRSITAPFITDGGVDEAALIDAVLAATTTLAVPTAASPAVQTHTTLGNVLSALSHDACNGILKRCPEETRQQFSRIAARAASLAALEELLSQPHMEAAIDVVSSFSSDSSPRLFPEHLESILAALAQAMQEAADIADERQVFDTVHALGRAMDALLGAALNVSNETVWPHQVELLGPIRAALDAVLMHIKQRFADGAQPTPENAGIVTDVVGLLTQLTRLYLTVRSNMPATLSLGTTPDDVQSVDVYQETRYGLLRHMSTLPVGRPDVVSLAIEFRDWWHVVALLTKLYCSKQHLSGLPVLDTGTLVLQGQDALSDVAPNPPDIDRLARCLSIEDRRGLLTALFSMYLKEGQTARLMLQPAEYSAEMDAFLAQIGGEGEAYRVVSAAIRGDRQTMVAGLGDGESGNEVRDAMRRLAGP